MSIIDGDTINGDGGGGLGTAEHTPWLVTAFAVPSFIFGQALIGERTCVPNVSRETLVADEIAEVEIVGVREC